MAPTAGPCRLDPAEGKRYVADFGTGRAIPERSAKAEQSHDAMGRPGSSYLWVGQDHHLNREEVAELVGHLKRWLDGGRLS